MRMLSKAIPITFLFLISLCCSAAVYTTNDITLINHFIQQAPATTLVVFDVDEVILMPTDQIFHVNNSHALEQLESTLRKRLSQEEILYMRSIAFANRDYKLVDERFADTLQIIQDKQLTSAALTHCGTGKFGIISKLENWRADQLKNLDVNFVIFNNIPDQRFPDINAIYGIPLVKSGIIFTGHADKGIVLSAVLNTNNLKPTHIIFVDDKMKNINAIEKIANKNNIHFTGFEYTAVKDQIIPNLNPDRVRLQFAILEREHVWLSDQAADELLQKVSTQY